MNIGPDLQAKLARLATQRGRDTQALVEEAIERFVDYDEWFLREVEKGLAAADRGELIDHEEIGTLINRRIVADARPWTERAAPDLTGICDYTEEHSGPEAALKVALRVYEAVGSLLPFPRLGRSGRKRGTRELVLSGLPFLAI